MEDRRERRTRAERTGTEAEQRPASRRADGPDRPRRPAERERRTAERSASPDSTAERRPADRRTRERSGRSPERRASTERSARTPERRPSERSVRARELAGAAPAVVPVEDRSREHGAEKTAESAERQDARRTGPRKKKRRPHRISNTNFKFKFLTMLAVVAVLILGLIIFFKVQHIEVVGNEYYTAQQIIDNSGVHIDDNLLSLSKASVSANIHKSLHYVEEVQIKKKLPGTVIIIVTEAKVTYSIQDSSGNWWLIDKNCKVLDSVDVQSAKEHTVIKGLQIQPPELGRQIKPAAADGADMAELSAKENALEQLLPLLEENPLAQEIVTVDLSTSYDIVLWYGTKYEIKLGTTERLEDKLQFLRSVVDKLKNENGAWTVDLSFTMGETVIASPRN